MDLTDRYLDAVAILLPKNQRGDIIAELRDVLMNRSEERAETLGRPLTQGEEIALLRDYGHPLLVAARYGRQQYLVGPELYPLYAFAVKVQLAIIACSALITALARAVFGHFNAGEAIGAGLGVLWTGGIISVGVLTVIAWGLQRQNVRPSFLDRWSPNELPRRPRFRRENWFDHLAGLIVQTVFILWWVKLLPPHIPYFNDVPLGSGQTLSLTLAPVWQSLYWPVLILALASAASRVVKLLGAGQSAATRGFDFALQVGVFGVAWIALRGGPWVLASGLDSAALAKIDGGVNIGVEVTLVVVLVTAVGRAAYNAWRVFRPAPAVA
jgi:hypothetical protein